MDLSINEIRSYIHCPFYYRFRYPLNTPLLKVRAKEHWSNCLKVCIIDFLKIWKQEDKAPTLQVLQDMWNKAWYEDPMNLVYGDRQTQTSLGNDGWLTLCKFYDLCTRRLTYIAAVEESYRLEITKGTYLTGTIDLLLHADDPRISKNYVAVKLVDSNYNASGMPGHNDIEMTAYRRGVQKLANVEPKLCYFVLDPSGDGLIETKRYAEQNEILNETVMAVAKSIQTANYYPHFGNWCNQCDYKPLCNRGKWIEDNPSVLPFTRRL